VLLLLVADGGASLVKHSNGPDWKDVATMLIALQELHAVEVSLCISANHGPLRGILLVTATAKMRAGVDTARVPSVSRSVTIGSSDPSMGVASMFRLMHELDRDCSAFWTQEQYPL
jgi:hypothetical protein